ncbi:MAG: histidine kinase [Desulfobulbaceae bacterium]|nr:MAG: histidine kinase [Desulfobulbaceae bacterium]
MKFFLGIQGKFILIASLCIAIFASCGGYLIIQREKKLYTEQIIRQAKSIAEISGVIFTNAMVYKELGLVDDMGLTDYLDYYVSDMLLKDPRILYLVVLDLRGKVLSHSDFREFGKTYTDPLTKESLRQKEVTVLPREFLGDYDRIDVVAPLRISTKSWGVCRIGFSLEEVRQGSLALRNEIISMVSLMLIISLLVISLLGKGFATPLVELAKAMDRITEKGDLDANYPDPGNRRDEIGRLQASFTWMIKRLHEANREKIRARDLMCQTEKMATVGSLAAGVAHEINNPLGGVILCFKNFTEGGMDAEAKKMHVEVINAGLLKIQDTVRGLLDFARKPPIEVVPTSIHVILEESLRLADSLLSKKGLIVCKELEEEMPLLRVDPGKIEQVFLNFIINAIHAMETNGTLTVSVRREQELCLIAIGDTGEGIAPDVLPRIFDPFFTTKEPGKGTGLGLAVCKSIIEQHGGSIVVESQLDKGTTFIIELPLAGQ